MYAKGSERNVRCFFVVVSLSPRLGGAQRNSSKNGGYNLFIDNKIRNEKQQQDRLPRLPPPEGRGRHTSHRKRIETHLKHSLLGPPSRSLDRRYQILRRCHRPTDEPRSCSCLPLPRGTTNQHQKIKTCRSKSGAQVSRLAHTNRRALVIISSWLLMFSLSPPPPRGGVVTADLAGVVVGGASMPKRKSNRPTPGCSVRCVCVMRTKRIKKQTDNKTRFHHKRRRNAKVHRTRRLQREKGRGGKRGRMSAFLHQIITQSRVATPCQTESVVWRGTNVLTGYTVGAENCVWTFQHSK